MYYEQFQKMQPLYVHVIKINVILDLRGKMSPLLYTGHIVQFKHLRMLCEEKNRHGCYASLVSISA